jgi:hypothetical protein
MLATYSVCEVLCNTLFAIRRAEIGFNVHLLQM